MMEMLKTESAGWNNEYYRKQIIEKLAAAIYLRWSVMDTEESLRDALSARGCDTQLSQENLQKLKVCALRTPQDFLAHKHPEVATSSLHPRETFMNGQ